MRTRLAPAAALLVVALAAAGCGGDERRANPLTWEKKPRLVTPKTLPSDRILTGTVKNESLDKLRVEASDVKVVDGDGKPVKSSAIFLSNFARSFFPYDRGPGSGPGRYPEEEKLRVGKAAALEPGQSVALTVSWHEPLGPRAAARIDYGKGFLSLR